MRFDVWAPAVERVELVVDGAKWPMARDGGGWWSADAPAEHGSRYGFSLDGGPLRADPRSVAQPDGVGELSAVYDHTAFPWTDAAWPGFTLPGAVLYELHVGTFSPEGTFDGAIAKLPHLVALGIDAVELMPIATGSGRRGWGYDGADLFAVHPAYGGPDGLKRFVDACHGAGIAVVIDVVYNHLGPVGNHLREFGPYFTDRHQTPWGDAVNFDGPESKEVRRFVIDNARMWLREFHVDGLRLDAVHAIVDTSDHHILAELAAAARELEGETGRPCVLVAESEANDPRLVLPPPEGHGLDAAGADDWHHALHTVLTGERDGYYADFGTTEQLAKAVRQAWVYDGCWSPRRKRRHGGSPRALSGDHFVVSTQTHDQVGNRAQGERLSMLTTPEQLRLAAALLLTSPFVPMLFQGEEWGATTPFLYFTDHHDSELGDAVREGRRNEFVEFGWDPEAVPDPQDRVTFERSVLDWREVENEPHHGILQWYRDLIALRRAEPDLRDPSLPATTAVHGTMLRVDRGSICVTADLANGDVSVVKRHG